MKRYPDWDNWFEESEISFSDFSSFASFDSFDSFTLIPKSFKDSGLSAALREFDLSLLSNPGNRLLLPEGS